MNHSRKAVAAAAAVQGRLRSLSCHFVGGRRGFAGGCFLILRPADHDKAYDVSQADYRNHHRHSHPNMIRQPTLQGRYGRRGNVGGTQQAGNGALILVEAV